MNYPDEDYVRFYTRETITWLALEYEGQVIMSLMLHGKFNRSGIFDCGGHDPSHAVTLATRCPKEVAERGLKRLLDSKTWVLNNGQIIWPNYVLAQTCKRSDRSRKRESRENLAREAMGDESHAVTRGHTRSQPVTPKPKPKQKPKPKPKPRGGESPPPLKLVQDDQPEGSKAPAGDDLDRSAPPPPPALSLQAKAALWLRDANRAAFEAPHPESWPEVVELSDRIAKVFGHKRRTPITHHEDPRVKQPLMLWAAGLTQQDLLDAIDGAGAEQWFKENVGRQSASKIFKDAERVQELILKKPSASHERSLPKRRAPDPDEEILAQRIRERLDQARANATPEELRAAEGTAREITKMAGNLFKPS